MFTAALIVCLAPAPFTRVPAVVPGAYTMVMHGVEHGVRFHGDGLYSARYGGRAYDGRWSQAGGVLRVEEWSGPSPPTHVTIWGVRLSGPRSGMTGGSPWRLLPEGVR